jgi:hypothetical protein
MVAARFAVIVERFPEDPSGSAPKTLKALRTLDRKMELGEAKALAQLLAPNLPCPLAVGIEESRARDVVDALVGAGGAARLEHSDLPVPLVARALS